MTDSLIDEEKNFYIRNGIQGHALDDMRREFYLSNIVNPDDAYTNDDLEVTWLQEQSGITRSDNADDLWFLWLSPIYGNKTVDDLRYEYYLNN